MEGNIAICCELLACQKLKIAFAESATAGALSAGFSLTEHSGDVLLGSIVCYDADEKKCLLQVPQQLIDAYTPESAEVTAAMARNAYRLFEKADVVVAVTGLVKRGGSEGPEKPVGTVFLHFVFPDYELAVKEYFTGMPEQIIAQTVDKAAEIIIRHISGTTTIT